MTFVCGGSGIGAKTFSPSINSLLKPMVSGSFLNSSTDSLVEMDIHFERFPNFHTLLPTIL